MRDCRESSSGLFFSFIHVMTQDSVTELVYMLKIAVAGFFYVQTAKWLVNVAEDINVVQNVIGKFACISWNGAFFV